MSTYGIATVHAEHTPNTAWAQVRQAGRQGGRKGQAVGRWTRQVLPGDEDAQRYRQVHQHLQAGLRPALSQPGGGREPGERSKVLAVVGCVV